MLRIPWRIPPSKPQMTSSETGMDSLLSFKLELQSVFTHVAAAMQRHSTSTTRCGAFGSAFESCQSVFMYSQNPLIRTLKVTRCSFWAVYVIKVKKHLLLEQNIKEVKEDISIVTLNIPNFHKAVIPRTKYIGTRSLHNSFDAKIVWNWRLQVIVSDLR